jgi:hypothetical protein
LVGGCIGKPSASLFCASRFSRLLFRSGFCLLGVYDQVTEMSKSGRSLDWADQWDTTYDDAKAANGSQKTSSKTTNKEKMAKAESAASVGMQKTKVYATIGMQKTR